MSPEIKFSISGPVCEPPSYCCSWRSSSSLSLSGVERRAEGLGPEPHLQRMLADEQCGQEDQDSECRKVIEPAQAALRRKVIFKAERTLEQLPE